MSIKNHKRLLFLFRFFLYAALVCYIVNYRYNFVFVMGGSMKEMYKHRDHDRDWETIIFCDS